MSIVTLNVVLAPFVVPTRVFEAADPSDLPTTANPAATGVSKRLESSHFPLSSMDVDTLVDMCDALTDAIFKEAGLIRPPK